MSYKIYIIVGEESGDILAAPLMVELKKQLKDVEFLGIGGKRMQKEGLKSLFPMQELSVMGIAEVLPKLPKLINRINQTVADVEKQNPDIIITVDSPDFCFRVIKKVKSRKKINAIAVHYVAPSVWAWRAGRAKKIAKFLDHIFTLLPFEPPYFEKEGLKSSFVGHPMVENPEITGADANYFRQKYGFNDNDRIISILAGSRNSELKYMLPIFSEAIEKIKDIDKNIKIISPTLPNIEDKVKDAFEKLGVLIITDDKYSAFKASELAIATSGTVALELAVLGTPTIIGYKVGYISSKLAKLLVKTKYVSLPNIILQKEVIPELLLEGCTAGRIVKETEQLLTKQVLQAKQKQHFKTIEQQLTQLMPSKEIAKIIKEIAVNS